MAPRSAVGGPTEPLADSGWHVPFAGVSGTKSRDFDPSQGRPTGPSCTSGHGNPRTPPRMAPGIVGNPRRPDVRHTGRRRVGNPVPPPGAGDRLATRLRPAWGRFRGTCGPADPRHPGSGATGAGESRHPGVQASAAAVSRRGGQTAPATPGRGESKHPPRAARPSEVGTDHPRPARNPRRVPPKQHFSDTSWSGGNARVYAQKQRGPGTLPKTPGNGCENVMR